MVVDQYIWSQAIKPSGVALTILFVIFLCYTLAAILGNEISNALGHSSAFTLLQLLAYNLLVAAPILLASAFYSGVVLSLNRLYRDSELPVMLCLGWSEWRLAKPVVLAASVLMLLTASLTLWVRPWAYQKIYQLEERLLQSIEFAPSDSGAFVPLGEDSWVLSTQEMSIVDQETKEMSDIFLYMDDPQEARIITAKRAILTLSSIEQSHVKLYSGAIYWLRENGQFYRESVFDQLNFSTDGLRRQLNINKRKTLPTASLLNRESNKEAAELQSRLNWPLVSFLLCVLAVPLSRAQPGSSTNIRILSGLALYAVTFYLISVTQNSIEQGNLNRFPGLWLVSCLLAVITGFLYLRPLLVGRLRSR